MPEYVNIYMTFDSYIWIFTIISIIVCGVVAAFLLKFAPEPPAQHDAAVDDDVEGCGDETVTAADGTRKKKTFDVSEMSVTIQQATFLPIKYKFVNKI